jgi:hypothetical protein
MDVRVMLPAPPWMMMRGLTYGLAHVDTTGVSGIVGRLFVLYLSNFASYVTLTVRVAHFDASRLRHIKGG